MDETEDRSFIQKSWKVPLATLLTLPFILQTVTTVGIVGYLSYISGKHCVENLAEKLITQTSNGVKQHLDNYLGKAQQINQINLEAVEAGILDLNDFKKLGKFFYDEIKAFDFSYINYGSKQGGFIGAGHGKNNILRIAEILPSSANTLTTYPVDKQGNRLKSNLVVKKAQTNKDPWYTDAVLAGKPTWSQIYTWATLPDHISISASAPVYNTKKKLLGVLGIDLELFHISKFLQKLNSDGSRYIYIIDRDGLLIASSTNESPAPIVKGKAQRLAAIDSKIKLTRETTKRLIKQFHTLRNIRTSQLLEKTSSEDPFIEVIPYQDSYGLDWLIITVVPASNFMQDVNNNAKNTLILCYGALIVSLITGILSARWVTEPIIKINTAAKKLASGEFVTPTGVTFVYELNELSDSFTKMSEQLKISFEEVVTQKAYLTNLLETLPVGVAIYDTKGSISYYNTVAQDLFSTPPLQDVTTDQLATTYNLYVFGTEQIYPTQQFPIFKALEEGVTCYKEDIEIAHQGNRTALEIIATPISNSDAQLLYLIVLFQDISTRKTVEKIILDYNKKLEEDIQQRTLALQQEITERKETETALQEAEASLRRANIELSKLVHIDGLTKIANRRCFDERLEQEWWRLHRSRQPLSLLLFDIDYFKNYNDYYGHQMGDECLVEIAQAVRMVIYRSVDLLARYGGEEFVVILPNTNLEGAKVVAEKIHNSIKISNLSHDTSQVSNIVTISLGISSTTPTSQSSPDNLVGQADLALYSAKGQGRNRSIIYYGSYEKV